MNDDLHIRSPFKTAFYGHTVCAMGAIIGFQIGLFNTFFDHFADKILEIQDNETRISVAGNLNFSLMFGIFANSLVGGPIIENLGRHRTLLYTTAANVVAGLVMQIPNLPSIYAARFIFGFCGGFGFNLSQIIFKEILPNEMGKMMGNLFYFYHTLAIMVSYAFGAQSVAEHWRLVFAVPLAFEIPKLLLYSTIFKYESPVWMKSQSRNIERDVGVLYYELYDEQHAEAKVKQFLEDLDQKQSDGEKAVSFVALFSRNYIRPFLICIFVAISNQTSGIAYLVFYSQKIYQSSGLNDATVLTFFMGSMNLLGGVFITVMSGRTSKRENLLLGVSLTSIFYAVMLFGLLNRLAALIILGSYGFMFSFGISLGGSMFPYFADAVPPLGLSIASSFVWLLNCVNTKFGLVITGYFGVFNLFFVCLGFMILAAVVLSQFSVETKNKSRAQIQEDFLRLRC